MAATRQVLAGAAILPQPAFRAPADGVLSDSQIDQFLRVRRASKGRTDAEAARALGIPPEEFAWARARIVEALAALDDRRVREASAEVYAKTLAQMRAARAAVRDPQRARIVDEQIAVLERERASLRREATAAPALQMNMQRVAGRRAELEPLAP